VVDVKNVAEIAQLGVIFLLFLIGLELSFDRLVTMRRLVFGLGTLQVALSAAVIGAVAAWFGNGAEASMVIGVCLALSSTAVVLELLSAQRRLPTTTGRVSFSVLLLQDLAVIPILLLLSILGSRTGGSVLSGVLLALAQAALAVVAILVIGRLMLRPLFRLVATTNASELFVAATLFVVVVSAVVAEVSGLGMALGAFLAGQLLAETEYRKAIETTIEPFKGLLLGIFFFTIGMNIDLRELAREPIWMFSAVVGLISIKSGLMIGLTRAFRLPWPAAVETSLLLASGGEFALVIITMAANLGLVDIGSASFALALTSLTMVLLPLLSVLGRRLAQGFDAQKAQLDAALLAVPPINVGRHAIVIGHGRVGQVVCDLLERHHYPFLSTDRDPVAVAEYRRRGREVYFGDATNPAFLMSCGLAEASGVIVTIHDQEAIDQIVKLVRERRPDVPIVSRARDATHARHLYAIGVTDAVPETIEASLQLSEAAMVGLGIPTGPAIASIHEKRDEFRFELQEAAGAAGLGETRSIRAKTARSS
jgi:CPA2 family monovalent cation:H+ antiporter-2